jgi:hypothetical protein
MKMETFRGDLDLFGPLNGTSDSEGYFILYSHRHMLPTLYLSSVSEN